MAYKTSPTPTYKPPQPPPQPPSSSGGGAETMYAAYSGAGKGQYKPTYGTGGKKAPGGMTAAAAYSPSLGYNPAVTPQGANWYRLNTYGGHTPSLDRLNVFEGNFMKDIQYGVGTYPYEKGWRTSQGGPLPQNEWGPYWGSQKPEGGLTWLDYQGTPGGYTTDLPGYFDAITGDFSGGKSREEILIAEALQAGRFFTNPGMAEGALNDYIAHLYRELGIQGQVAPPGIYEREAGYDEETERQRNEKNEKWGKIIQMKDADLRAYYIQVAMETGELSPEEGVVVKNLADDYQTKVETAFAHQEAREDPAFIDRMRELGMDPDDVPAWMVHRNIETGGAFVPRISPPTPYYAPTNQKYFPAEHAEFTGELEQFPGMFTKDVMLNQDTELPEWSDAYAGKAPPGVPGVKDYRPPLRYPGDVDPSLIPLPSVGEILPQYEIGKDLTEEGPRKIPGIDDVVSPGAATRVKAKQKEGDAQRAADERASTVTGNEFAEFQQFVDAAGISPNEQLWLRNYYGQLFSSWRDYIEGGGFATTQKYTGTDRTGRSVEEEGERQGVMNFIDWVREYSWVWHNQYLNMPPQAQGKNYSRYAPPTRYLNY